MEMLEVAKQLLQEAICDPMVDDAFGDAACSLRDEEGITLGEAVFWVRLALDELQAAGKLYTKPGAG